MLSPLATITAIYFAATADIRHSPTSQVLMGAGEPQPDWDSPHRSLMRQSQTQTNKILPGKCCLPGDTDTFPSGGLFRSTLTHILNFVVWRPSTLIIRVPSLPDSDGNRAEETVASYSWGNRISRRRRRCHVTPCRHLIRPPRNRSIVTAFLRCHL